jgi:hypothetical protein
MDEPTPRWSSVTATVGSFSREGWISVSLGAPSFFFSQAFRLFQRTIPEAPAFGREKRMTDMALAIPKGAARGSLGKVI